MVHVSRVPGLQRFRGPVTFQGPWVDWAPNGDHPWDFLSKPWGFLSRCCDFPVVFQRKSIRSFDNTVDGSEILNNHLGYRNLVNNGISYISTGAGFLLSTVWIYRCQLYDFFLKVGALDRMYERICHRWQLGGFNT